MIKYFTKSYIDSKTTTNARFANWLADMYSGSFAPANRQMPIA